MQLGIPAVFRSSDTAGRAPFFADWLRCGGLSNGCIDHQPVGLAGFTRKRFEYPVEHAQTAPADEAAIKVSCKARIPSVRPSTEAHASKRK